MMKRKRYISVCICLMLILAMMFSGCSKYSSATLNVNPSQTKDSIANNGTQAPDNNNSPTSETPTDGNQTVEPTTEEPDNSGGNNGNGSYAVEQMTEESIQALNDGNAQFVYSDQGYLTFLKGRYCEQKIESWQDAADSLNCVAQLLGIMSGSDWLVTYGESDGAGYTYWVLQQKYAGLTVAYGTVRIAVDPDGYTAGISSSITPEMGIANTTASITVADAEAIVDNYMKSIGVSQYYLYSEYTTESIYAIAETIAYRVYCIYTNNPYIGYDAPYLEHIVSTDGDYLLSVPAKTMTADRESSIDNSGYFDGLEADTWSGTVTWDDGSKHKITVPVAYNPDKGVYYLADVERKIMVADYSAFDQYSNVAPVTSKDNKDWEQYKLLQMYNICRAYDFYAGYGIKSSDGMETPILLLTDYVDDNGNAIINAFSMGMRMGWRCFAFSSIGNLEQSVDVFVHEYTHSVTQTALCGNIYNNETGAINESYSDIMGELYEQICEEGDDAWTIGQTSMNSSGIARSMSSPNDYNQPAYVGDRFYMACASNGPEAYDYGGVHTNSGLLNHVAYLLNKGGIPVEQEAKLWLTTTSLLTPKNSYDEIYLALLMSVEINGYDEKYKDIITDAYNKVGLLGDRAKTAAEVNDSRYGKIKLTVDKNICDSIYAVILYDYTTGYMTGDVQVVGADGNVSMLVPEGNYYVEVRYNYDNTTYKLFYSPRGAWVSSVNSNSDYISVEKGGIYDLGRFSL